MTQPVCMVFTFHTIAPYIDTDSFSTSTYIRLFVIPYMLDVVNLLNRVLC